MHLNFCPAASPSRLLSAIPPRTLLSWLPRWILGDKERERAERALQYVEKGSAYYVMQKNTVSAAGRRKQKEGEDCRAELSRALTRLDDDSRELLRMRSTTRPSDCSRGLEKRCVRRFGGLHLTRRSPSLPSLFSAKSRRASGS